MRPIVKKLNSFDYLKLGKKYIQKEKRPLKGYLESQKGIIA